MRGRFSLSWWPPLVLLVGCRFACLVACLGAVLLDLSFVCKGVLLCTSLPVRVCFACLVVFLRGCAI